VASVQFEALNQHGRAHFIVRSGKNQNAERGALPLERIGLSIQLASCRTLRSHQMEANISRMKRINHITPHVTLHVNIIRARPPLLALGGTCTCLHM